MITPVQFGAMSLQVDGTFQLSFNGTIGIQYTVETSTNLTTWLPLTNVVDNANPVVCTDGNAPAQIGRFYRVHP